MIGESSGVTTLLTNERIYRDSQAEREGRVESEPEATDIQGRGDEVTISAEAIALARAVTPVNENSAQSQVEAEGRGQRGNKAEAPRFLDIRV